MLRGAAPASASRRFGQALLLALGLASCGGGSGDGGAGGGGAGAGAGAGGGGAGLPAGGLPPTADGTLEAPTAFADLTAESGSAAGQVVLRFTPPGGTGGARADAYEVRAQVPHLTGANVLAAPTLPVAGAPGAPGAPEALVLGGLEDGQTLQLALRARFGAAWSPFSYAVGARVKDGGPPAPPASAIHLQAPGTLDQQGATYVLDGDLTATGTAFRVTARGVTLDLGGHTVTYGTAGGTANGLYTEYLFDTGKLTVRNGRFVQGTPTGTRSHAVVIRGGHDVRLSRLQLDVQGPDSDGILVYEGLTGALRIDHCTIACRTTVVTDRHFPGCAAIWLGALEGTVEVDHNLVTASPQWGIKVQGRATNGTLWIHHNRVLGTKALYANGYGIGVHKPNADVFENEIRGESRGIHLDGIDNFGIAAEVHDNVVRSQDQPNAEYPQHWTHGLKVEGPAGARVHHNRVLAVADPQHAEAIALDVALGNANDVDVHDNLFAATSNTPTMLAHALNWSSGTYAAPNLARFERNVFRSTDRAVTRAWAARVGGVVRGNAFVHDASAGHPWVFEYFDVSDVWVSPGHRLVDAWTDASTLTLGQWAGPAAFDSTREATLRVGVVDAAGAPVAGAAVAVDDVGHTEVARATTGADGRADLLLVLRRITNGPTVDVRGPFTVRVDGGARGAWSGGVAVDGRTALRVHLGAGSGGDRDVTAPGAPVGVQARALSASRALLWWSAPADASGIALYEVWLDGELAAVPEGPVVTLGGLDPQRTYAVTVKAVDAGGNRSAASPPVGLTLRVEDRGP